MSQVGSSMKPGKEPHAEPEIIPPDYSDRTSVQSAYHFVDPHGTYRFYAARLGPFGIIVLALVIGIVSTAMLIIFLGAVLIWIPVFVVLVAFAVVSSLIRR
jgi:hypothetical protein